MKKKGYSVTYRKEERMRPHYRRVESTTRSARKSAGFGADRIVENLWICPQKCPAAGQRAKKHLKNHLKKNNAPVLGRRGAQVKRQEDSTTVADDMVIMLGVFMAAAIVLEVVKEAII